MTLKLTDQLVGTLLLNREPYGSPNPFGNVPQGNCVTYFVTGPTWPVRNRLKEWGCRWDPLEKRWVIPNNDVFEFLKNDAIHQLTEKENGAWSRLVFVIDENS